MIFTITCDNGVCNNLRRNKDLDQLKEWHNQGLIEIQVTDAIFADILGGQLCSLDQLNCKSKSNAKKRTELTQEYKLNPGGLVLGSPTLGLLGVNKFGEDPRFEEIKDIVFGNNYDKEKHFLDVRHLALHLEAGNDFFITFDEKHITSKQDDLIKIGINPKTPKEFISFFKNHLESQKSS
tara:strand:- start:1143 stop:1682 length:540 start_codon:yes stop_codon:yes gene_type:complete